MDKRKTSIKSENELAKKYGGKRIAGSGCGRKKGDVFFKIGNWIFNIDDKTFVFPKKSFSINADKFFKHIKDCKMQGEIGIMRISFDNKRSVIVIAETDFEGFINNDN